MKPYLTPGGWHEEKCVCWNVSVGLKCVGTLKHCIVSESFTFINAAIQKCRFQP